MVFSPLITQVKVIGRHFTNSLYTHTHQSRTLSSPVNINDIKNLTLEYMQSLRLTHRSKFIGYRHSYSTTKPILYDTLAVLLLKHLYNVPDEQCQEELASVLSFQSDDGLFRDPVIACSAAETEVWWGWQHLTLHALMTLALYGRMANKKLVYLEGFYGKDIFLNFLRSRDWADKVCYTSNEVQNIGVMLQYVRDFQNEPRAGELLNTLYDFLDNKQDLATGLYGTSFKNSEEMSLACQAGYHFWLLYFYDHIPINHKERIIDSLLTTQNILGGYAPRWNSSACEDIDSIDPFIRFSRLSKYRHNDIQASLKRALPAVLANFNVDGGWVFRRHEALTIVHRQMHSNYNESNLFYSWFRTLGLAYLLSGLEDVPPGLKYKWNFKRAFGHQFLD